jgi:catechol 2,3-dioxygenase-like lactoylglutathione lyase family enzyme
MIDSNRGQIAGPEAGSGTREGEHGNKICTKVAVTMADAWFTAIAHVQLAMPRGEEQIARRFYGDLLCMVELPKPPALARRGGCWFQSGTVEVHLGVEDDFRRAKKAHPALVCRNYADSVARLRDAGVELSEVEDIPGVRRCYVHDPFGNRIELVEA